jgi:hypothetical protein
MESLKDYKNKDFDLTDELRALNIQRFAKIGPVIRVVYDGKPIVVNFKIEDIDKMMNDFRKKADKTIVSNGIDKSKIVDKLTLHMTSQLLDYYEKEESGSSSNIKEQQQQRGQQQNNNNHQSETSIMKYTLQKTEESLPQLWETVKVDGKHYLVSYDPLQGKVVWTEEIEEESRILKPESENGTQPYRLRDRAELENFIEMAKLQTLGTLFEKVKRCVSLFYDTDNEAYTNLVAADIILTYFQDRVGKTHYIFVYGEPGTGKGTILECFNQLGYRGVAVTDASAATIYRVLGNVDKGQVTMIIDEANRLEDNPFLLDVLKVGYKGEAKVPRVLEGKSGDAKPVYFYAYCFKVIAAEKLPASWKTGGFLSRCLVVQTSPGDPAYDIGDIVENAGDPKNAKIMQELVKLRKLLFAYRLLHYSEPIPDLKIKGIRGRDRELIKPLLRLFKTHGDSQSLATIKTTLHHFIKQRNEENTKSFEATIHTYVTHLLNSKKEKELPSSEIWEYIKTQLHGHDLDGKPDTIKTSLFGEVSRRRLAHVLKNLGGKNEHDSSGTTRVWKFNIKTLHRFSKAYETIPNTIEIIEQETLESAISTAGSQTTFSLFEEEELDAVEEEDSEDDAEDIEKKDIGQEPDASDASDTCLEKSKVTGVISESKNQTKSTLEPEEFTTNNSRNNDNLDEKNSSDSQLSSREASDVSEASDSSSTSISHKEVSEEEKE